MKVKYRLIDNGRVVGQQVKEMDGTLESNAIRISSDIYDEMDPAKLAMAGKRVTWVEMVGIEQ